MSGCPQGSLGSAHEGPFPHLSTLDTLRMWVFCSCEIRIPVLQMSQWSMEIKEYLSEVGGNQSSFFSVYLSSTCWVQALFWVLGYNRGPIPGLGGCVWTYPDADEPVGSGPLTCWGFFHNPKRGPNYRATWSYICLHSICQSYIYLYFFLSLNCYKFQVPQNPG